jgi:hypothetical protein
MIRLYLWFCRVLSVAREPWVRWAPGLPCALFCFEGETKAIARTQSAPRECGYASSWLFEIKIETPPLPSLRAKRSNPDHFGVG